MKRLVLAFGMLAGFVAMAVNGDGGEKKGKDKGPDGTWAAQSNG